MATLATIALCLLLFVAAEQIAAVVLFVRYCRRTPKGDGHYQPKALVVLPVRGADETLADCVDALIQQDYADFRLRVIFDSPSDPGWEIVEQVLESHPSAAVELLQLAEIRSTCSLKCSAVYEATEDLGDAEVVALIDSDIAPDRSWLAELVAPLASDEVAVAHGNRWYLPTDNSWGSLLRYFWNAAAVATMYFWGMPWGGSVAVKRQLLEKTDIRQRWLRAGCEDVPLGSVARSKGLKVRFVPSLIMRDCDNTSLRQCFPFLDRQLLWARLYHPLCWWASNIWQVLIAVAMSAALLSIIVGIWNGQYAAVAIGVMAAALPNLVSMVLVGWIERTLLPTEQGPVSRSPLRGLLAIAFTNIAMIRVIFVSLLARSIDWRGITYRIAGPWRIEMVLYRPYESNLQQQSKHEADLTEVSATV